MGYGIDYSCGARLSNGQRPNVDEDTNIRYGVINANEIVQAWADSSEPKYPCEDCECWNSETESCNYDEWDCEASEFVLDDGEYIATQSRDDSDIFVIKSPFYTYAYFCSPCAPGACYLMSPVSMEDIFDHENRTIRAINNRCYCFGKDWFDGENAPYPIWRVDTHELVYTPEK